MQDQRFRPPPAGLLSTEPSDMKLETLDIPKVDDVLEQAQKIGGDRGPPRRTIICGCGDRGCPIGPFHEVIEP